MFDALSYRDKNALWSFQMVPDGLWKGDNRSTVVR